MQLPLGLDPRTEALLRLQALLIQRFGRIKRAAAEWRRPEWVLVQGVIGARTKSEISNAATHRLLKRFGSWEAVADVPLDELQSELSSQTYSNIAAERLKGSLTRLIELRQAVDLSHLAEMETLEAMHWLERLPGVGRKIAAGVMNASTLDRRVIVLDGHHTRILRRMGLVPSKASTDRAFKAIMPTMPDNWDGRDFDEHHLLMKMLGQAFCRPAKPVCRVCPALSLCETGLQSAGQI